jgi:ABC-2 type transport system permease protein
VLFGQPVNVEKLPGWIEFRGLGLHRIILGVVAALTAAAVTRGAEESGTLECVLSACRSRVRVFVEHVFAALVSLGITCAIIWAFILASPAAAGEPGISLVRSFEAVLNLFVAAAFGAGLTFVACQFTTSRRVAALIGGGAVIAMHIWDNLANIAPALTDFQPVSPFYLNSRSTPLANGHVDALAMGSLALLTAACIVVAAWLLSRRDFAGAARLPGRRAHETPAQVQVTARDFRSELDLRSPFLRGISEVRAPVVAWGLGLALFCGAMTAIAPNLREAYTESSGPLRSILGGEQITDTRIIALLVFSFVPLLASFYAVTLAASWADEELDGRLELEMACPEPRARYFLQRLGSSVVAVVLVLALAGAGMYVGAAAANVELSWGKAALALALLIPFSAAVVSFSYLVSSVHPRMVVGLGSTVLVGSYLWDILVVLFGWPSALRDVSVFYLYGMPLINGVDWLKTAALIVVAVALAGAGSRAFDRRDIAR